MVHVGPTSEKEIDELVKKEQEKAWGTVGTMIAIVLGYLALILFLGFCYSKLWADPLVLVEKPLEAEAFAHGAFGCLEDEHRAISIGFLDRFAMSRLDLSGSARTSMPVP